MRKAKTLLKQSQEVRIGSFVHAKTLLMRLPI